ncbi:MAG: elongation factor P [Bacillota bacterium]
MIRAGDFRNGMTFEIDGEPYIVEDFQHVKPGKGAAFVRTKYRNLLTGTTKEEAFSPSDKFNKAHIETREMQYLYKDGDLYYFMDVETFEQTPVMEKILKKAIKYLKESDTLELKFYEGKCIDVVMPNFVELEVVYAEPGIKGDSASNVTKSCEVETGAEFQVPMFVESGDVIKIDTRTDEYVTRV